MGIGHAEAFAQNIFCYSCHDTDFFKHYLCHSRDNTVQVMICRNCQSEGKGFPSCKFWSLAELIELY